MTVERRVSIGPLPTAEALAGDIAVAPPVERRRSTPRRESLHLPSCQSTHCRSALVAVAWTAFHAVDLHGRGRGACPENSFLSVPSTNVYRGAITSSVGRCADRVTPGVDIANRRAFGGQQIPSTASGLRRTRTIRNLDATRNNHQHHERRRPRIRSTMRFFPLTDTGVKHTAPRQAPGTGSERCRYPASCTPHIFDKQQSEGGALLSFPPTTQALPSIISGSWSVNTDHSEVNNTPRSP